MRLEASYYTALGAIPPQGIQFKFGRFEDILSVPETDNLDANHQYLSEVDGLALDDKYARKKDKDAGFMTFYPRNKISISGRSATFGVPLESVEDEVRAETGRQVGEIFPGFTIICEM